MASRSDKMYGNSPKMERDDKGKQTVKRKAASKPKHNMGEMGGRHSKEMEDMHKRHIDEHKAMAARHEKEAASEAQSPPGGMPHGAEEPGATT